MFYVRELIMGSSQSENKSYGDGRIPPRPED